MTTQTKNNKAKAPKAEGFEDTIQNAAKASNDAMQDGFEKAMRATAEFGDHMKANTEAMVEGFTIAGQGVEAISTEISAYSKTSLENGVAVAQAMASAKSIQEVVELQADYAKSAMDAWLVGLGTLTGMSTTLVKEATKPINDRTQATMEMLQNYS